MKGSDAARNLTKISAKFSIVHIYKVHTEIIYNKSNIQKSECPNKRMQNHGH